MSTIDFVEVELGGDKWKITWDTSWTFQEVRTVGEKYKMKRSVRPGTKQLTPSEAYDIAMDQLDMLIKEYKYVK
jgi:hypothetical protein